MASVDTFSFGISLDLLEPDAEHLSLQDFANTVKDLREILSALENHVIPNQRGVEWDVDSDPTIRIVAHVNGVAADQLDAVVGRAFDTFQASAESAAPVTSISIPTGIHSTVVRVLNRFRKIADIEVTATGRNPLVIEHEDARRPGAGRAFSHELSAVDGTLEIINVHGSPHFVLFEHGTGHRVRCSVSDDFIKDAASKLRGRVVVNGMVKYRSDGRPVSIRDITAIDPVPDPTYSIQDLRGTVPNITGDVPSGEFVRRLRDPDGEHDE